MKLRAITPRARMSMKQQVIGTVFITRLRMSPLPKVSK